MIVLNKALNDMVHVARANAGLDEAHRHARRGRADPAASSRRCAGRRGSCRSTGCTTRSSSRILAFVGRDRRAVPAGRRWSTASSCSVLLPLAVLALIGHFVAIMASKRVRS